MEIFTQKKAVTDSTGLTKGTLSKHLTKLRATSDIEIEKSRKGNFPNTSASLTSTGIKAFDGYRRQYNAFSETMGSGKIVI